MGVCGTKEPDRGKKPPKIDAQQQAKVNEASKIVKQQVKDDVRKAVEEASKLEEEANAEPEVTGKKDEDPEKKAEEKKKAKRKAKKAKKRLSKLETLEKAREVEAMTLDDYNAAIRRLLSITGEDPTNPGKQITLPEGLEWMTAMLEVMWPSVQRYTEKITFETLQPILTKLVAGYGATLEIEEFKLGANSPAFGPMGARKVPGLDGKPGGGVELSLGITYRSDMNFQMKTSLGTVGVQNIDFHGTLYIWLRPFVDEMPLVGGYEMAFVNPPRIELDWTGFMGSTLELGALQGKVRSIVDSSVAAYCVVPNFMAFPMHPSVDAAKLKCPAPEGLVRVTVVKAMNLPSTDFGGGCDPFVQIRVGAQTFRTTTKSNQQCPVWNETFDFLVYNQEQWLIIEVLDDDNKISGSDDLIGSVHHLPVDRLVKRRIAEVPLSKDGLPLVGEDEHGDDYPACTLQLRAEWVEIRDGEAADSDRLVSVRVGQVAAMPDSAAAQAPYTVRATVDGRAEETKGCAAKPKSYSDPAEVLDLLRRQTGKTPAEAARVAGLSGEAGAALAATALEQRNGEYVLAADDSEGCWWMKRQFVANHSGFPDAARAVNDDRVVWAGETEDQPTPLASQDDISRRKAFYAKATAVTAWHTAVSNALYLEKQQKSPYWETVLHVNAKKTDQLTLEIVGKDTKVLGSATLTVTDTALGDEPDLKGPFEIVLNDAAKTKVQLDGDVRVKSLRVAAELPSNWNLQADSLDVQKEFTLWWKEDFYYDDWQYQKEKGEKWTAVNWPEGKKTRAPQKDLEEREVYYKQSQDKVVGSGTTATKEAALKACLRAGSITWGDYDVLIGKLNGEDDVPTIAETLEWVNLLIGALWPNIKVYSENLLRSTIEPACARAARKAGAALKLVELDVKIPKADLGTKPPNCNTIQVQKIRRQTGWGGKYSGMVMTLHNMSFVSNIDAAVEITVKSSLATKVVTVGAKDVVFRSTVKVTMGPMLPDLPMIGAMQISLPNPPELSIDFSGLSDVLVDKIPGMNTMVTDTIVDSIAAYCCTPNVIVVPMIPSMANSVELAYPKPVGVLRVMIESANSLQAGDVSITGAKSSDAYVKMRAGSTQSQTDPVTSLNPEWTVNNVKHFVIHDMDQHVEFEVLDADGVLGGADDTLGCVWSKETVLGGGVDLIRKGMPVRALLRLGAKAGLRLGKKQKDEVSSSDDHAVFEEIPCKGEDGRESALIVTPMWLNIGNDGNRNLAYLLSVELDRLEGCPPALDVNLNGPFRVRAGISVHTVLSKPGTAKSSGNVNGSDLFASARLQNADGESAEAIAKLLQVDVALVQEAVAWEAPEAGGEKLEFWRENAAASVAKNKAIEQPQYLQRMHQVVPIDRDDEPAQLGRWKAPVKLEVVNVHDDVVAACEVVYDLEANTDLKTGTTAVLHGPFRFSVNLDKTSAGMFSFATGAKNQDSYTGTWSLYGSIVLEGLKQRIMDAD
ncbi:Synaptotagmin-4 [Diplonema papillatum]|nr:Synaptotagmin-4 [Diplonema papillatum]